MKRFYAFLLLLFSALLGISFLYGTFISWLTVKLVLMSVTQDANLVPLPFSLFFKFGFFHGLLYALVLLLGIVLLMKRSIARSQKFTIRKIISIILWFYLVTTAVFFLYFLSNRLDIMTIMVILGPQFILSPSLWLPFPLAWLTLFIILGAGIRKPA